MTDDYIISYIRQSTTKTDKQKHFKTSRGSSPTGFQSLKYKAFLPTQIWPREGWASFLIWQLLLWNSSIVTHQTILIISGTFLFIVKE